MSFKFKINPFKFFFSSVSQINALKHPRVKKCVIISDSIAKHVADIRETDVRAFPGMTTSQLTSKISRGCINLNYDNVLIHIGTNDVNSYSAEEILSLFSNLISIVKTQVDKFTKIYISTILPRPVDFIDTGTKVKSFNVSLEDLCKDRKVKLVKSFRPFLKNNQPRRELFEIKDGGLHLNLDGTRRLRQTFINTVAHM